MILFLDEDRDHLILREAPHHRYFFLVSRTSGDSLRVNTTISSPVAVLMSWCKLTTLTPVTSAIMASITAAPSRSNGSAPA